MRVLVVLLLLWSALGSEEGKDELAVAGANRWWCRRGNLCFSKERVRR